MYHEAKGSHRTKEGASTHDVPQREIESNKETVIVLSGELANHIAFHTSQ